MAAPNPDRSEQIASTYQFRAFTDRQDPDEVQGRRPSAGVVITAGVLVAALVIGVIAVLLTL